MHFLLTQRDAIVADVELSSSLGTSKTATTPPIIISSTMRTIAMQLICFVLPLAVLSSLTEFTSGTLSCQTIIGYIIIA